MITVSSAPESRIAEATNSAKTQRNPLKKLDAYIGHYETAHARMKLARERAMSKAQPLPYSDQVLAIPERYASRSLRGLIQISRYTEEVAEGVSDLSGLVERFTRNFMSSGNKSDIAQVIGAGIGRLISSFTNAPGVSIHKAIGAGFYMISVVTGSVALCCAKYGQPQTRRVENVIHDQQPREADPSLYDMIAGILSAKKAKMVDCMINRLDRSNVHRTHPFQRWCRHLSEHHTLHEEDNVWARRSHCNYMWTNLHQYGPITKILMSTAYGVFQGINKIFCSYDKYLGTELGQRLLAKRLGELMGMKVALCLATSAAALISIPMAPLQVGLSTIGACACALALVALIAAKIHVRTNSDWRGNFLANPPKLPARNQVFGRVTPT